MIPPEPHYTRVAGSDVAYQVIGKGTIDLVYVTGIVSNLDVQWEFPPVVRVLERLSAYTRLIMFDRRGTGLSDPIAFETLPTWEHWVEDLTAVLDSVDSERAAILTQHDGGFWGMLFAATHPERTRALAMWCPWARGLVDDQYTEGLSAEYAQAQASALSQIWGTRAMAAMVAPTYQTDDEALRWMAKFYRASATPRASAEQMHYMMRFDIRDILASIRVPTLVLHRKDWPYIPASLIRYVADNIPDSRFVEFPGSDANIFTERADDIQDVIEDFLSEVQHQEDPDRVLATVLFTDVVDSTKVASGIGDRRWKELLALHDDTARRQIERFRGRLVATTGDGLLVTFDGPGRAIRCALALGRALRTTGLEIRAGIHTGEIELRPGDDIGGIAVHIASRVMNEAAAGEVICSRTVKDLVAGSEFAFDDRGVCTLKGVPDQWQLYAVRQA